MAGALTRFALLSGGVIVLVVVGVVIASQALAEEEARRDATVRVQGMALGLAKPFVDHQVREGDPEALGRLAEILQARIEERGVSHIVLWGPSEGVIWADDPDAVDADYVHSSAVQQALATQGAVVKLPEERSAQARYPDEELLEVYVGLTDREGVPFLFEAYLPPNRLAVDAAQVQHEMLLLTLGALLVLLGALTPLFIALARTVGDAQEGRDRAFDRSVASWRHQRRLLGQELHDGVIQDLAAIGYGLTVLDDRGSPDETARTMLSRLRSSAVHAERSLRSIVADLTPTRLAAEGLGAAAEGLVERYRGYGLDIDLRVDGELDAPEGSGVLAFRALREGLRNVAKHSDAGRVRVRLGSRPLGGLEVTVADDGTGPLRPGAVRSGQGLRLLADTVADVGGTLTLTRDDEGGTTLEVVVPPVAGEPGRP